MKEDTVTIKFEGSERAIDMFKAWMCEMGEQDYWNWMEFREQEREGSITLMRFDYNKDNEISAIVGRLNSEE